MIPYGRQSISSVEIQAAKEALESDYLTNGPRISELERNIQDLTGARFAVVCSSGTAALHLACLALGVGPGDLGITSAITFLASANCIELCGGSADFVDIDPTTLCLDPGALEEYCQQFGAPKVVVAVDYAGLPAAWPELKNLSERFGFSLVADCAHSLGTSYSTGGAIHQCGSCAHSDIAAFSFHPLKNITTGEGGAVTTNNPELAEKLRLFRSHGMRRTQSEPWYYEMVELGLNYRMTDIQAAIGSAQIKRLSTFKEARSRLARFYNEAFSASTELIIPPQVDTSDVCRHLYPIQFLGGSSCRRDAYDALLVQGFHTQVHYIPVYWQPYYIKKYGYERGKCPCAEQYYSRCLSLPLFPDLSIADASRIASTVQEVLRRLKAA